jgi:hypothetical protein
MEDVVFVPDGPPFNSPLETGIRALIILNALYPTALDLSDLLLFDHLVVHTADFSGPPSLHPDILPRSGEPLVRRRLIENGLRLMRMRHLIEIEFSSQGILYRATEEAAPLIGLMRTSYAKTLVARANWLAAQFAKEGAAALKEHVIGRIGRWHSEFQRNPQRPSTA